MSATFYRPAKVETKPTSTVTLARAESIVDFIISQYDGIMPRVCLALQHEVHRSNKSGPTEKLVTWLNVIANLLKEKNGKMIMTDEKAKIIEFIIVG